MVENITNHAEAEEIQIADSDDLYRWVHRYYQDTKKDGTVKLKPGLFRMKQSDEKGISLFLARLMPFEACCAAAVAEKNGFVGIATLSAIDFRAHNLDVSVDNEGGVAAHVEVIGYKNFTDDELADITRDLLKRARYSEIPGQSVV